MADNDEQTKGRRSIWRHRGRRLFSGMNLCVAMGMAVAALLLFNLLASRFYRRWDLSESGFYRLSPRTEAIVQGLPVNVDVTAFFQNSNPLYEDVRLLLETYRAAAERVKPSRLRVELVDPDRDLGRARELSARYDLHQANVVVFDAGGRRKYVEAKDLADVEYVLRGTANLDKKIVGFKAEEAFSSAILSVSHTVVPVVYMLSGHGECDPMDYGQYFGYSSIARAIRRDNIVLKTFMLDQHGVPADAAAVVVARPERRLSPAELDLLGSYLNNGGRLVCLLDPGVRTGLEPLLLEWGVKLSADVVVGVSLTGRELLISNYGDHPASRLMRKLVTVFYTPRSVEPLTTGTAGADRPRATALALTTEESWAETDLKQHPPKFDAAVDRRGPISVAVAVEKGSGAAIGLRPTRLVVFGDSAFVANDALEAGSGANRDFFLNAINWVLDRETVLAIGPKKPGVWSLDMDRHELRMAYIYIVGVVPAVFAALGLIVWLRRRA